MRTLRVSLTRWAPRSMIWRLWRGLAVFAVVLVGAALLAFNGVRHEEQAIALVVRRQQPLQTANLRARSDFASAQASLRGYLLFHGNRSLQDYRAARTALASALVQADTLTGGASHRVVELETRAAVRWLSYADLMERLSPGDARLARLTAEGDPSAHEFYRSNSVLGGQLRAQAARAITTGQHDLQVDLAWSGVLALVALLLGLVAAAGTVRGITRPLAGITTTLRQLTSGDHTVRAEVIGSTETREVARSLNALAEESDRMRRQEEESNRLRATARAAGFRIREHLHAGDVIREARAVIEQNIDADLVYLLVTRDAAAGPPVWYGDDSALPPGFLRDMTPLTLTYAGELLRQGSSAVVQDVAGPAGDQLPPAVATALRGAGVVSHLITPFGFGTEVFGVIAAGRMSDGRPWTSPEVSAVESIAADLGRGLHHAWLYEEEDQVIEELKSLDRAKSDFLATVSHELRTPLTSIAGYVELLRDGEAGSLNTMQERMLEAVDRNTGRLRSLIEDVLTLSKIESGAFRTSAQPVDLVEITSAVVTALVPAAAARGIAVTASLPPQGLVVSGDPGQLDRALMNVVSNALKFTPGDGRVEITARKQDGAAVITVRDTGIGVSAGEQEHLFRRFFRGSNAVERSIPGTGLGLAIVRTILDKHGGQVTLESREEQGTTVTLRLPLLAARGLGPQETAVRRKGPAGPMPLSRSARPAIPAGQRVGPGRSLPGRSLPGRSLPGRALRSSDVLSERRNVRSGRTGGPRRRRDRGGCSPARSAAGPAPR